MTRAAATATARGTWAKRPPAYQPQRCITLRPAVYDLLNARRAGRTWADYLCALACVKPPQDRRRNRVRVSDTVNGHS